MSGFLDTSVVVRYLTGDPPDLADRAARIVDGDIDLQIDGVALVEAAYVLSSVYQVPRHSVVDHLVALVQKRNITLFGPGKADCGASAASLSSVRKSLVCRRLHMGGRTRVPWPRRILLRRQVPTVWGRGPARYIGASPPLTRLTFCASSLEGGSSALEAPIIAACRPSALSR